jgi:hypothetical protein
MIGLSILFAALIIEHGLSKVAGAIVRAAAAIGKQGER